MMQLGLDELNVVARQFSLNTLQAVENMTKENCYKIKDIYL